MRRCVCALAGAIAMNLHVHQWRTFRDDDGLLWLWCFECGHAVCWTKERETHEGVKHHAHH